MSISFLAAAAFAASTTAAYLYHKKPWTSRNSMPTQLSDWLYGLCHSSSSVSALLAEDPSLTPGKAAARLYRHNVGKLTDCQPPSDREPATAESLQRAFECGNFGPTKPSELFLRIFHDALLPLEQDPLAGCVSPPLMGSHGVIPLTVIGTLPDIARHMVRSLAAIYLFIVLIMFLVQPDSQS